MADLDSENKRRAAPNMILYVIAPVADGTIGAKDRVQASYIYAGISIAGAVVTVARSRKLLLILPEELYRGDI